MRISSARCSSSSSSGGADAAYRVALQQVPAASTSRCRRRSPPESASSTGGTGRSAARRPRGRAGTPTRSRARVRLSWAATRPGGGAPLAGEGGKTAALRLVCDQQQSFVLGELLESPGHRLLVLACEQVIVRCCRVAGLVEAVAVAPLAGIVAPHRCHQVARRADRVRLEHAVFDAVLVLQNPRQGLLHEVFSVGMVRDPSPDHPPQDRQQTVDIHAHCECALPGPPSTEPHPRYSPVPLPAPRTPSRERMTRMPGTSALISDAGLVMGPGGRALQW